MKFSIIRIGNLNSSNWLRGSLVGESRKHLLRKLCVVSSAHPGRYAIAGLIPRRAYFVEAARARGICEIKLLQEETLLRCAQKH